MRSVSLKSQDGMYIFVHSWYVLFCSRADGLTEAVIRYISMYRWRDHGYHSCDCGVPWMYNRQYVLEEEASILVYTDDGLFLGIANFIASIVDCLTCGCCRWVLWHFYRLFELIFASRWVGLQGANDTLEQYGRCEDPRFLNDFVFLM